MLAIRVERVSCGTNRTAGQKVYDHTAGRAGVAYSGTGYATAQVAEQHPARYQARAPTRGVAPRRDNVAHDCRGHKPESKRACENPQARGPSSRGDHRIPSLGGNSTTLVSEWR